MNISIFKIILIQYLKIHGPWLDTWENDKKFKKSDSNVI